MSRSSSTASSFSRALLAPGWSSANSLPPPTRLQAIVRPRVRFRLGLDLLNRVGGRGLAERQRKGDMAMTVDLTRRDVLKMSAGLALGAAGGFSCVEMANAAPIEVPPVDQLTVRVLVDSTSDLFFRPQTVTGVRTEPGRSADCRAAAQRMGSVALLESQRGRSNARSCSTSATRPRRSSTTWIC